MRAVNLLPKDEARSGPGLPSPWVLLAAARAVVAGSLVYLGYSIEHATVADKRAELAAVQVRLDRFTAKQAGLRAQGDLVGLRSTRAGRTPGRAVEVDGLGRHAPGPRARPAEGRLAHEPERAVADPVGVCGRRDEPDLASPGTAPLPTSVRRMAGIADSHDQIAQLLARLSCCRC